jgi:hypothetical protein
MKTTLETDRRHVRAAGAVILGGIMLVSAASSFIIFRSNFTDLPGPVGAALALFCVFAIEGGMLWLLRGLGRAFSTGIERVAAVSGVLILFAVMLVNVTTHAEMSKGISLSTFQAAWLHWAGIGSVMFVFALLTALELADPEARLRRLELQVYGAEREAVLTARANALRSDAVTEAMDRRSEVEADRLAVSIIGSQQRHIGFASVETGKEPRR